MARCSAAIPQPPASPRRPSPIARPEGFRATDAALLPDGRLLVLNRRASWLEGAGAALVLIDPRTIRPGAVLTGREIARLEWPLIVDNMEGLSVTREERPDDRLARFGRQFQSDPANLAAEVRAGRMIGT